MRSPRASSRLRAAFALSLMLWTGSRATRADPASLLEDDDPATAPVVLDGVTLMRVRGVSSWPAPDRAQRISERIAAAAKDPAVDASSIRIVETGTGSEILAGTRRLVLISDADAAVERVPRTTLADTARKSLALAVERYRAERTPAAIESALGWTGLIAFGLIAVLALIIFVGGWVDRALEARVRPRFYEQRSKAFRMLGSEVVWSAVHRLFNTSRLLLGLAVCYVAVALALRQFPWTREAANGLLSYVLDPLRDLGRAAVRALPNLIVLTILFVIARWVLRATRLFAESVEKGAIQIRGFDPTWAVPTYRLLRMVVVAFALIAAYPYIPGSSSEAFKAVSIFGGILFSLGSSSVIASIIAGYTMTYRKTFRIGDRVKIGDVLGDVEQIGLMVTRVRTIKNEEAVIPNSTILQAEVLNYSAYAREGGLILHVKAGIGYEVPWRQVEALLLLAADRTPGVLREPRPFVLQRELADFCVNYELNVHCADAHLMLELYTELHRQVLDAFNEFGVQIMTPAYRFDPAAPKIVPRDQWYAAPARMEPAVPPLAGAK